MQLVCKYSRIFPKIFIDLRMRQQEAEDILQRFFKVLRGSLQYRRKRATFIIKKFAKYVILRSKPKRMRAARCLSRFLHPLLRKRRMRKLRHVMLKKQKEIILLCLVPPISQDPSLPIGTIVALRDQGGQKGIVVEHATGHGFANSLRRRGVANATVDVQMLSGEGLKTVQMSTMVVIPDGVQDISDALSVQFDDLVDNRVSVLERCEASLRNATRIMHRRAKIVYDLMLELKEIWGNGTRIPALKYMTTEFEKQAHMSCKSSSTDGIIDGNIMSMSIGALMAINQSRNGGFRLETMEMSIRFWYEQFSITTNEPCPICMEYCPSNDLFECDESCLNKHCSRPCKGCLREYFRIEMTEGRPIWKGVRCFCGCSGVFSDEKIKTLFAAVNNNEESSSELEREHVILTRKLRHRRITSAPFLRFCPNSKCGKEPAAMSAQVDSVARYNFSSDSLYQAKGRSGIPQKISLRKGDYLQVSKKGQNGWSFGLNRRTHEKGWFPSAYAEIIQRRNSTLPDETGETKHQQKQPQARIVVDNVAVVDLQSSDTCWRCYQRLCLKCGAEAHDGRNCANAHDVRLEGMVQARDNWVRCPKCKHVLERISGCDHMTCKCGAEFCFCCGSMPHCGQRCTKKKSSGSGRLQSAFVQHVWTPVPNSL